jgi:hypothetical protein
MDLDNKEGCNTTYNTPFTKDTLEKSQLQSASRNVT